MATEKLKFKIELYATMWHKPPQAEILIDNHSHFKGDITGDETKPNLIVFEQELEEGKEYNLIINRSGKGKNQTVINEKGDILKDQLLHIKSMEIDEIDIGALVYEGIYTPKYPEPWATQQRELGIDLPESETYSSKIHHNGNWYFNFKTPIHPWFFSTLNVSI